MSISALQDDTQHSLQYKQMHICWGQALITDEDTQLRQTGITKNT
jgi:hypothetical protein